MRPISRLGATTLVALALAVIPVTAASAHVRVVPEQTTAGGWTVLALGAPAVVVVLLGRRRRGDA